MIQVAQKERTQRVQLHVGLLEGSHGEFTCTQSLPLRALFDERKGLRTRFLGPYFEFHSYAGYGYVLGFSERANTEGLAAFVAA
jgi:hypothetical protein